MNRKRFREILLNSNLPWSTIILMVVTVGILLFFYSIFHESSSDIKKNAVEDLQKKKLEDQLPLLNDLISGEAKLPSFFHNYRLHPKKASSPDKKTITEFSSEDYYEKQDNEENPIVIITSKSGAIIGVENNEQEFQLVRFNNGIWEKFGEKVESDKIQLATELGNSYYLVSEKLPSGYKLCKMSKDGKIEKKLFLEADAYQYSAQIIDSLLFLNSGGFAANSTGYFNLLKLDKLNTPRVNVDSLRFKNYSESASLYLEQDAAFKFNVENKKMKICGVDIPTLIEKDSLVDLKCIITIDSSYRYPSRMFSIDTLFLLVFNSATINANDSIIALGNNNYNKVSLKNEHILNVVYASKNQWIVSTGSSTSPKYLLISWSKGEFVSKELPIDEQYGLFHPTFFPITITCTLLFIMKNMASLQPL